MMTHTRLWASAGIITTLLIAGFIFSVPHTRDLPHEAAQAPAAAAVPNISIRDSYKKGVHTISGTIEAPDACTTAAAEAYLEGGAGATSTASTTQSILVAISMSPDEGVCLQLPTETVWSASIAAPNDLPLSVTVNGAPATTTAQ